MLPSLLTDSLKSDIQSVGKPSMAIAHSSTDRALASTVATALQSLYPEDEVLELYSDGANWSRQDITSKVLAAIRYAPETHRHLVLSSAHRMTPRTPDILLKVIEELPLGFSIWMTHPSSLNLPSALRGRASSNLSLPNVSEDQAVALLSQSLSEVPQEDLHTAVSLADLDLNLAFAALRFDMLDQLRELGHPYLTSYPQARATNLVTSAAHLAIALHHKTAKKPAAPVSSKGSFTNPDLSRLSPAAKSSLRNLIEHLFDKWVTEVSVSIVSLEPPQALLRTQALHELLSLKRNFIFSSPIMTIVSDGLQAQVRHQENFEETEPLSLFG